MHKLVLILFIAAMGAFAEQGLAPPQLGFIDASDHTLRPVLGISGNLLLGSAAAENVEAAAFSGSVGLVKTTTSLMAFDATHMLGSVDAAPGPALFAFASDGSLSVALMPESGLLLRWTGKDFETTSLPSDLNGLPLAIAVSAADRVCVVVQRLDGLWLIEGSAQTAISGVQPALLLANDGSVLYASGTELVLREPSGSERRIQVGVAIGELHWMGTAWIQIVPANSTLQYALHLTSGQQKISQLPEPRP